MTTQTTTTPTGHEVTNELSATWRMTVRDGVGWVFQETGHIETTRCSCGWFSSRSGARARADAYRHLREQAN